MMRSAPLYFAPWITLRPTPPQPITATVSPRRMSAVFAAAPKPVSTPQPMSAARVSGTSSSMRIVEISGHTSSSEKVPRPDIWCSGTPPRAKRGVMSSWPPVAIAMKPGSHISGVSWVQK